MPSRDQRQFHCKIKSRIRSSSAAAHRRRIVTTKNLLGKLLASHGTTTSSLQCVRRGGPQLRVEFGFCALRDHVGLCIFAQCRDNCRPGSGHERCPDFRLLEQPHLELRDKNKFLEDRALQIVEESLVSEFLSCVRDAWNFERVLPVSVCPRCRYAKLRLQQEKQELVFQP